MNQLIEKEEIKVENIIYEIRGKQVMLDCDLAKLYKTNTKRINEAARRNSDKFPERFYWRLTKEELQILWSQFATTKLSKKSRSIPSVFTEQGVAMLATILKTPVAVQVTIEIMDAFVAMKKYIGNNLIEQRYINNLVLEDHKRINLLQESFNKLEKKTKCHSIFFEGQIYDAYSVLIDILNNSKEKIIIIDNYAGKELLDIIKELNKNVTIISKNLTEELIKKYKAQYSNVNFKINNSFHDRFIIIDNKILYHCGASFKDLGKKCFAISLIDDAEIINKLLCNLKNSADK